jgi:hypothetical protein
MHQVPIMFNMHELGHEGRAIKTHWAMFHSEQVVKKEIETLFLNV